MHYCIYCGFPMKDEDAICPRCGAKSEIQPDVTVPTATQAQPDSVAQPTPDASTAAPVQPEPATQPDPNASAVPPVQPEPAAARQEPPRTAPQYMPGGYPPVQQPPYYEQGRPMPYPVQQPPEPLSLGTIVGMLVLGNIPLVGWIVMLIWAFERSMRPNRRNLARGILIVKLISWALFIFLWVLFAIWGYSVSRFYYY